MRELSKAYANIHGGPDIIYKLQNDAEASATKESGELISHVSRVKEKKNK